MRQRARALFAPGRAVLRVGDGAVAARRIGAVQAREPVAELHALGLEAGRVGVGDVDRDHVHDALLRDQARGGDAAGDVHAADEQAACHPQTVTALLDRPGTSLQPLEKTRIT